MLSRRIEQIIVDTYGVIKANKPTIDENVTIPAGTNGLSAGTTVSDGYNVTIQGFEDHMTSKIVVNNIEADAGISTVFFNSDIGQLMELNVDGNLTVDGVMYEDVTNRFCWYCYCSSGIHVTSGLSYW